MTDAISISLIVAVCGAILLGIVRAAGRSVTGKKFTPRNRPENKVHVGRI